MLGEAMVLAKDYTAVAHGSVIVAVNGHMGPNANY